MRIAIALVIVVAFGLYLAGPVAAETKYQTTLGGIQEVPPVLETGASGVGDFTLDATRMFLYDISCGGLMGTETSSHVCGPAPMGANGPVIFDIQLGPRKVGWFGPLTAQHEADLNAGLWYVNICSTAFPAGEIRGQIEMLEALPVEGQTWGAIKELYRVE